MNPITTAIAGYPYCPHVLKNGAGPTAGRSIADEFHLLLVDGKLGRVKEIVAARPDLLAELLPIVANPEASINVRVGASVIFENHAGTAPLRALLPQLGELSNHADARVRADACHYLGLSGDARARGYLDPCLRDENADVREIAADSMEALAMAGA